MKPQEIKIALEEIKAEYRKANRKAKRLQNYWFNNRREDNDAYRKYKDAEVVAEKMHKEVERLTYLCGEKCYANEFLFSDAKPWEVVEVLSDTRLLVREMKATLKEKAAKALAESFVPGGFFGHRNNSCQEWDYESVPENPICEIRMHKDGKYYLPNCKGSRFILSDHPYKWYDYNF